MNDTDRIVADLARCKQRIAEMEAGTRGVISEDSHHMDAGAAFSNQLQNLRRTQERLEMDYVLAMLGRGWGAAAVIEAMQRPKPEGA